MSRHLITELYRFEGVGLEKVQSLSALATITAVGFAAAAQCASRNDSGLFLLGAGCSADCSVHLALRILLHFHLCTYRLPCCLLCSPCPLKSLAFSLVHKQAALLLALFTLPSEIPCILTCAQTGRPAGCSVHPAPRVHPASAQRNPWPGLRHQDREELVWPLRKVQMSRCCTVTPATPFCFLVAVCLSFVSCLCMANDHAHPAITGLMGIGRAHLFLVVELYSGFISGHRGFNHKTNGDWSCALVSGHGVIFWFYFRS